MHEHTVVVRWPAPATERVHLRNLNELRKGDEVVTTEKCRGSDLIRYIAHIERISSEKNEYTILLRYAETKNTGSALENDSWGISKITVNLDNSTAEAYWFDDRPNNEFDTVGAAKLQVADLEAPPKARMKRIVSPEELRQRLEAQTKIGKVGEIIAFAHEKARLISQGATELTMILRHVALEDTAAGFDIHSEYNSKIRYIEVKASTTVNGVLYVSPNEIAILQKHGQRAYLYIVHVADVQKEVGIVTREIQNPFESGQETPWISPALFMGKPPRKYSAK